MPFTEQAFFQVFQRYNDGIWPAQLVLYAVAILAVALARRGTSSDGRYVAGSLALLWAWAALAYHAAFFSALTGMALVFAALFLIQSALLVWYGVVRPERALSATGRPLRAVGAVVIAYALVLYPIIALMSGQRYPAMPTFGAPCPIALFTLGILMWMRSSRVTLYVIPVLWALIATQVAVRFRVYEDFGLTLAAFVAIGFLFANRRGGSKVHSPSPA